MKLRVKKGKENLSSATQVGAVREVEMTFAEQPNGVGKAKFFRVFSRIFQC